MIYSIHIPKTAGTSFRKALEIRYGEKLALYYGPLDPKTTPILKDAPAKDLASRVGELADRGYEVLHGHYRASSVLSRVDDPSRQVWTWLRDPVERVLSHYGFYKERPLDLDRVAKMVRTGEMDLVHFSKASGVRDIQSKYLAGLALSELAFVGVTERFELGLALLFGAEAPRLPIRYNAVSEKNEAPAAERTRIAALNARDMQLYGEGMRLFLDRVLEASEIEAPERPAAPRKSLLKKLIGRVA